MEQNTYIGNPSEILQYADSLGKMVDAIEQYTSLIKKSCQKLQKQTTKEELERSILRIESAIKQDKEDLDNVIKGLRLYAKFLEQINQ